MTITTTSAFRSRSLKHSRQKPVARLSARSRATRSCYAQTNNIFSCISFILNLPSFLPSIPLLLVIKRAVSPDSPFSLDCPTSWTHLWIDGCRDIIVGTRVNRLAQLVVCSSSCTIFRTLRSSEIVLNFVLGHYRDSERGEGCRIFLLEYLSSSLRTHTDRRWLERERWLV